MKRGYIYLLIAALAYASMGILVKFLAHELSPLWQVTFRLVISTLLAYVFLKLRRKKTLLHSKKFWPLMLFMGVIAFGTSMLAYTYAFNYTAVSNVLFILSTYPILTALFAYFFLKEKLTKYHIAGLFILVVGTILIFNPANFFANLFGNMLSFYVALTFSIYIVISRFLSNKGEDAETITFLSIAIGAVSTGIYAILFDKIPHAISFPTLLGILLFGALNFVANGLVNLGFKTAKASLGTMILMLEGIIGSILAFFIFRESPTVLFSIGACLVLFSVYISTKNTN